MSITLAGSGGGGGVELTSDSDFLPLLESNFVINRIFSVALVYCDKMSTIASLGAKNILDSGGFFKGVQHLNIYKENFYTKRT